MNTQWLLQQHEALGTYWWIEVPDTLPGTQLSRLRQRIQFELKRFESTYSRFRGDSLLSELNRTGQLMNPPAELLAMLRLAAQIADLTDQAFNPCLGRQLSSLGYDAELSFRPHDDSLPRRPMHELITVTAEQVRLRQGYALDLGGIGKGFLVDQLAHWLESERLPGYVINAGGDLRVKAWDKPLSIALKDATDAGKILAQVELKSGAIACSSPWARSWPGAETDIRHTHILGVRSTLHAASVVSPTAAAADALATALCAAQDGFQLQPTELAPFWLIQDQAGQVIRQGGLA